MKSYVEFSLIGAYADSFISFLIEEGFRLSNIRNDGGIFYARVKPSDYRKIARFTYRYRVRMRIVKKHGGIFFVSPYKSRYGIAIGALLYAIVIGICSSFIWEIKISGNVAVSDDQVLKMLDENGIRAGADPDSFDSGHVEFCAKLAIPEISWISIEKEGARVYVKVNERLEISQDKLSVKIPCNVIAQRTGVIVSTEVYRGELLYPVGSAVREGDVIVSGVVEDSYGKITYNNSDARIIAEFTESVDFSMPLVTKETVKTGKTTEVNYIRLFSIYLSDNRVQPQNNYIYDTQVHNVSIFGLQMPWKICTVRGYETTEQTVERTTNDVKRLLLQQADEHERNFYSDYEIVNSEKIFSFENNTVSLHIDYTLRGDIAKQQEFSVN